MTKQRKTQQEKMTKMKRKKKKKKKSKRKSGSLGGCESVGIFFSLLLFKLV